MSFFHSIEEPMGPYFPQGNSRGFPPLKDDPEKSSMDPMAWAAPRSPELSDYPQFNLPVSKVHAGTSTSFSDAQYSGQHLSPVSPAQASFSAAIHSPQVGSETYEPISPWNSFGMPSPTPEYDLMSQHSYTQQGSTTFENFYVSPSQVNSGSHYEQSSFMGNDSSVTMVKQEPDTFGGGLAYAGGFSQAHGSAHAASSARDYVIVAHPSAPRLCLTSEMEIDHGAPATPPEEDTHSKPTPPPRNNGRDKKRPKGNTKEAQKLAHKRAKAARSSAGTSRGLACKSCDESFGDSGLLQDHVQKDHARPLVCVFGYAGCAATFGSKNEWKRHVVSQHIILLYWLCTDEDCVRANPKTGGTVFNRKDLYTQHVRRMHVPDMYKDAVAKKEHNPAWDRMLRRMQDDAERKRCELPTYMECPVPDCPAEFRGTGAWDDRMEHVARHLDGTGSPSEPPVIFGGDNDRTLTDWAQRPDVNIVRRVAGDKWELVVPLKTTAKEAGSTRKLGSSFRPGLGDEDADGELE